MGKSFKSFSNLKLPEQALPPPEPVQPKVKSISEEENKRLLSESGSAEELFAKMIGGNTAQPPPKPKVSLAKPTQPRPKDEQPKEEKGGIELALLQKIEELQNREKRLLSEAESLKEQMDLQAQKIQSLEDQNLRLSHAKGSLQEEIERKEEQITALKRQQEKDVPALPILAAAEIEEFFPHEVREHLLETLKEGREQAINARRSRRAEILDALLAANADEGLLAEKRKAVSDLLSTATRLGEKEITAMEAIGFQFVTGRNHYKFKMGSNSVIISKTPSDYRGANNLIAEIKSRFF